MLRGRMRGCGGLLVALGVTALSALCMAWGSVFFVNMDPLWFLHSFTAEADELRIYWDGQNYILFPDDPDYDTVMKAFQEAMGNWEGSEPNLVLSPETLDRMRGEWRMLEVYYRKPVQVHISSYFPRAKYFFVSFSGSHFRERRVFASASDVPKRSGALNFDEEHYAALRDAVEAAVKNRQPVP